MILAGIKQSSGVSRLKKLGGGGGKYEANQNI